MKFFYIFLFVFSMSLMACNGSAKKDNAVSTTTVNQTQPAATTNYTSIPQEVMVNLFENASYIDYIFHNLPFSMSQDDKASIQATLGYVGQEGVAAIPAGCKPIARQMFQIGGEIVEEFDIYFSDNCYLIARMKNEKTVHLNAMSQSGIDFFTKMIAQGNKARNQAQNQFQINRKE